MRMLSSQVGVSPGAKQRKHFNERERHIGKEVHWRSTLKERHLKNEFHRGCFTLPHHEHIRPIGFDVVNVDAFCLVLGESDHACAICMDLFDHIGADEGWLEFIQ